jgi:hypothetical protein
MSPFCHTSASAANFSRSASVPQPSPLSFTISATLSAAEAANGCRCRNRLAGAVERGFVTWPDRDDLDGDRPLIGQAHQDIESLYPKLPPPP